MAIEEKKLTTNYLPRTADGLLERRLAAFGAVSIVGPKGCGKTTTAKQRAASVVEFKLGSHEVEEGAKHLCEIERLVREHNKTESQVPIRPPDLKLVITGTEYGFRRDDGVLEIPIGCPAP